MGIRKTELNVLYPYVPECDEIPGIDTPSCFCIRCSPGFLPIALILLVALEMHDDTLNIQLLNDYRTLDQ